MYCKHCGKEIADDSKFCRYCGINLADVSLASSIVELNEDNVEKPISKTVIEKLTVNPESITKSKTNVAENPQVLKNKPLPLVRRFIGSLMDKAIILTIVVAGYVACKPYSSSGDIGFFMGLMNNKPSNYEYIDKVQIETYGTFYEGVNIEFQKKAIEESEVPYIGYTRDFDIKMCFIFIFVSLIYYLLLELTLRASIGKGIFEGKLVDEGSNKLSYWRIPLRSLFLAAYSALIIYEFRFCSDLDYYTVLFIYFFILDFPLLVTKRSLLDLCTRTMYVDTAKKKDLLE